MRNFVVLLRRSSMLEREVENLLEQQLRKLNWKLEVGQKDR